MRQSLHRFFKSVSPLCKDIRFFFALSVISLFTLMALFADYLQLYDPELMDLSLRLQSPSWAHPFGNDIFGRDLWSLVLHGARQTFIIVLSTVLLSTSIGILAGILAGYFRGFTEILIMRTVDILMAFPGILLAMSIAAFLGPSLWNIVLAISITGWTSTARLVRAQVITLREREYVLAAHSLGAKHGHILIHHIFPFLWTPLLVSCTFSLSGVLLMEASLSFLGFGANSSIPTWGALLFQGRDVLNEAPTVCIIPGVLIATVIMSFNFLGDILRDILDPKR